MRDILMMENQSPTTDKFIKNQEMLDWNVEQEITLFQQILRLKPIGPSRQWKIMCVRKRMQALLPHYVITSEMIWDKLMTMFDLEAIEELHKDVEREDEIEPEDFELPSKLYFEDIQILQPPSPIVTSESKELSPSIALIPENFEVQGTVVAVLPIESEDQILSVIKEEPEDQSPSAALISEEPQESIGLINISRRKSMKASAEPRLTRRKSKVLETANQDDVVSLELSKSECSLEDVDIKGEEIIKFTQMESPQHEDIKSVNGKQKKLTKSTRTSTDAEETIVQNEDEHNVGRRDENEPEMPILEPAGLQLTEKDGIKETDPLSPPSTTFKTAKKNTKKGKVSKNGKTRRS